MKISPVEAELLHADGRADGQSLFTILRTRLKTLLFKSATAKFWVLIAVDSKVRVFGNFPIHAAYHSRILEASDWDDAEFCPDVNAIHLFTLLITFYIKMRSAPEPYRVGQQEVH
jgi:hypothetical protein